MNSKKKVLKAVGFFFEKVCVCNYFIFNLFYWKQWFKKKNKIYQLYLKNKSNMVATNIETLQNLIYETLESCKSKYYENISKNYALKP